MMAVLCRVSCLRDEGIVYMKIDSFELNSGIA